jgi:hypothetical protein
LAVGNSRLAVIQIDPERAYRPVELADPAPQ